MALPIPINPFEQRPKAGLEAMALQPPAISKPSDLASGNSFLPKSMAGAPPAAPAPTPQANPQALAYLAPATAGLGAGSQVQPTTSAPSAVMQTVGAGAAGAVGGAVAGAAVGGPVGAAVGAAAGGLIGLVSGGISSYFGLKDAREQRRKQERDEAYIRQKNEEHDAYIKEQNELARSDNQEQQRYTRRQAAMASQMNAYQSVLAILNKNAADNEGANQLFLERGR
jgi:outer membrane lipoprotein SlyB